MLSTNQNEYPVNVQGILNSFDEDADPYKECIRIVEQLEQIGWTAEYDLSGTLFDIHCKTLGK